MPAKPTVTVYDATGNALSQFSPEKFSQAGWVDIAFLPGGQKLLAYPHHWTCRGLAGQSMLPADDHASTMWLLDVASGEVRAREFPNAIASVAVGESGTVVVSCWNGQVYRLDEKTLVDGDLPAEFAVGQPALVHVSRDGSCIIAATTAGEVLFLSANGEVRQRVDLKQVIPGTEKPWVQNAKASPLAQGLWQLPGGRVESDLGGQRVIEAPDGLILIEGHAGLSFESSTKKNVPTSLSVVSQPRFFCRRNGPASAPSIHWKSANCISYARWMLRATEIAIGCSAAASAVCRNTLRQTTKAGWSRNA